MLRKIYFFVKNCKFFFVKNKKIIKEKSNVADIKIVVE